MSSFLQADIFFFITSVGVVAFIFVGLAISFYLIQILSRWLKITKKIQNTVNELADGIMSVKDTVSKKVEIFGNSVVGQFLLGLAEKRMSSNKKTTPKKSKKSTPKKEADKEPKSSSKITGKSLAQKLKNSDIM